MAFKELEAFRIATPGARVSWGAYKLARLGVMPSGFECDKVTSEGIC